MGICYMCGNESDKLYEHHWKAGADDTVPVCPSCNQILKEPSGLFVAWEAQHPNEYPPMEFQKLYVRYKNKESVFLAEWKVGHQLGNSDYEKKKECLRKLWEPCYREIFPEKNIFTNGNTTLLTMYDLDNIYSSLGLFNEFGHTESYPLPTCLTRYSYKHPVPQGGHIRECLISIPECRGKISTEGLSEDDISYVMKKMEDSLRTFNYDSYGKAVGVYRDILYLGDVLRGKKRRARKSPWGETPKIEFLTRGISDWAGCSIWAFGKDCEED